jgi:1-aminocyclopropane-1-carboxylate deaminase/D-cysteine desulfhydrase-like pyridoxal-dependent ACC family enzyme
MFLTLALARRHGFQVVVIVAEVVLLWMVVGTWLLIHYIALDVVEYPS